MCKYSVVVPIYNVEEYLDKCLQTLQDQTFKDFEVICVNDGTKDDSQKIIDKYVAKDKRFKSFIKENGGLASARNYGIKQAKGDYVLFIDSDDYASMDMLESININLNGHDMLIFGYNQLDVVNNTSEAILPRFEDNIDYNLESYPDILNNIDNCAWNKCYKAALFSDVEYPQGYLHEDLGTTYILLEKAKSIGFIKKPLIYYLLNRPGNITTHVSKKILDIFDMCKVNIDYFKANKIYDKYYDQLENLCWKNIVECLRKLTKSNDLDFSLNYVDLAFDFMAFNFSDKKIRKIALTPKDYIYEYRWLCKLYLKMKGEHHG